MVSKSMKMIALTIFIVIKFRINGNFEKMRTLGLNALIIFGGYKLLFSI